ncbi:DinB family protein [Olivibacter ginsenosidimutans]|uniref:DinB family protein n=1 Tax=Olivibacter ginsenosidimutans TaxID=1176537 RepID=A0ABP9AXK3_9SPHI
MQALFKAWKASRKLYLDLFDTYSLDQLNKIPAGFNNNMIWNIGHIIATQHKLIYKGSNLHGHISDELFNKYQSGTKPTEPVSQQEADELKTLLTSQIEQTINDYQNGIFVTYNERTTGIGFHLTSVQDAFECNNFHEGLHLGYAMSIRKFV